MATGKILDKIKIRSRLWGNTDKIIVGGEGRLPLTSIVILSYNTYQMTKLCIESIRRYTEPGTYEIIVVDNASTDESVEYLKGQTDIKCALSSENLGFPKGCNIGISIAQGTEILLLNSDTIVTPRWLSNLRRALYSGEDIGAVSCVTNYCSNWQKIEAGYASLDGLRLFADRYNQSDEKKWVPFFKLVGFCLLVKKSVADKIGNLDEAFSPGNFEDDDYSFRIREAGYKLLLCRDTYIHHFGSASFTKSLTDREREEKARSYNALLAKNKRYFCQKWQVGELYDAIDTIMLEKLPETVPLGARLLHVGCDCGAGLFYLQEKYPGATCSGIAYDERGARVTGWSFTVQVAHDAGEVLGALSGKYHIIVIRNVEHLAKEAEALDSFLQGVAVYLDDGGAVYFTLGGESFVCEISPAGLV